ncbi:Mg2+ and Co2+ transporter CorA [Lysinibacillus parviboronicapiens]|uniref:Mg2+ and Co2+ transporter CorA n=1 Tax=Lysinibacillus parviboronicapiens TaxID=436516 RepID=A0ABV2PI58_9BACI
MKVTFLSAIVMVLSVITALLAAIVIILPALTAALAAIFIHTKKQ